MIFSRILEKQATEFPYLKELISTRIDYAKVRNEIKTGGYITYLQSSKSHPLSAKIKENKNPHDEYIRQSDKEAALKDTRLFQWFKDKWIGIKERKVEKKEISIKGVIKQQAKINGSITFIYTNLAGERTKKEVDPYEIRDGYLWALDHRNKKHIKKFFISKMENVKPGKSTYSPLWEIKMAEEIAKSAAISTILRNPGFLRAVEASIGGAVGAGLGVARAQDPGMTDAEKRQSIVLGTATGIAASLSISGLIKSNILHNVGVKRQAKKWTMGKYMLDKKTLLPKKYPSVMKNIRNEIDEVKNPKLFKKYFSRWESANADDALNFAKKDLRKRYFPELKRVGEVQAFEAGLLRKGEPKLMNSITAAAFAKGRTLRGNMLRPETGKVVRRETLEDIRRRLNEIDTSALYDNTKMMNRIRSRIDKKLFRLL